jgi:hypothetical protein
VKTNSQQRRGNFFSNLFTPNFDLDIISTTSVFENLESALRKKFTAFWQICEKQDVLRAEEYAREQRMNSYFDTSGTISNTPTPPNYELEFVRRPELMMRAGSRWSGVEGTVNVPVIQNEKARTRLLCTVSYNWYLAVEGKEAPDGGWNTDLDEVALPQFQRYRNWLEELAMCMAIAQVKKNRTIFFSFFFSCSNTIRN